MSIFLNSFYVLFYFVLFIGVFAAFISIIIVTATNEHKISVASLYGKDVENFYLSLTQVRRHKEINQIKLGVILAMMKDYLLFGRSTFT